MGNVHSKHEGKISGREVTSDNQSERIDYHREVGNGDGNWMELVQDEGPVMSFCKYCDESLKSVRMGIS